MDGKICFDTQLNDLESAMENVAAASDVTIAEGTGHCAVGSIVGLNNAKVASLLGADMVCVVCLSLRFYRINLTHLSLLVLNIFIISF